MIFQPVHQQNQFVNPVSDRELEIRLLNFLFAHPGLLPDRARISVERGQVRLEGKVGSESDRLRLEAFSRRVAGVRAVDNRLKINPRPVSRHVARRAQRAGGY